MGLQLAEELASGFGIKSSATEDFLDVFTAGFAFRLFLHSTRYHILTAARDDFMQMQLLYL